MKSMSIFILIGLSFFSFFLQASEYHINCEAYPGTHTRGFSAKIDLSSNDDQAVEGIVDYKIINKVNSSLAFEAKGVVVSGKRLVYPAGSLYVNETRVFQLISSDKTLSMTLALEPKDQFASRILSHQLAEGVSLCKFNR